MSNKCILRFFSIFCLIAPTLLASTLDTLFIKSGQTYLGMGEWAPPGQIWAITQNEAFPLEMGSRKPGCLDMSEFTMIPPFRDIWFSHPLDSSFRHYPYVQTGLPEYFLSTCYDSCLSRGILSFRIFPDTSYIRSGDVVEVNYPGTFTLKGLLMGGEISVDTLLNDILPAMEQSVSLRERERLSRWRNLEFPIYFFQSDYLCEVWYNATGEVSPVKYKIIHEPAGMKGVKKTESIIIRDPLLLDFLKKMHQLKKAEKEYLLDTLTGSGFKRRDTISPVFIFLDKNPLEHESQVVFWLIGGKFIKNP